MSDASREHWTSRSCLIIEQQLKETCKPRRLEKHHLQSWLAQRHRKAHYSPAQHMEQQAFEGPGRIMEGDWVTPIILPVTDPNLEFSLWLRVNRGCALLRDFWLKCWCPTRFLSWTVTGSYQSSSSCNACRSDSKQGTPIISPLITRAVRVQELDSRKSDRNFYLFARRSVSEQVLY